MKSHPSIFKSLLFLFALTAIAVGLVWVPGSAAISDRPGTRSNSPVPRAQDDKGEIIARLKDYDPKVHGYGFRNYGRDHDNESDLDAGDLIKLFGADNVCQSGTTASDCVLYEPAEEWLEKQFKMLANGHCDGLALTSLRFWLGSSFESKASPADWQSGARKVSDLEHTQDLSNYVAYIHVMQSLEEIYTLRREQFKRNLRKLLNC